MTDHAAANGVTADGGPAEGGRAEEGPAEGGTTSGRNVGIAVAVLLAALAAVAGLLLGSRLGGASYPEEGSVDAGFARDMRTHHLQAVEMGVLVREATDDPAVRQVALDIVLTQQQQAGQMYAWLETWGLPQSSTQPAMAWSRGDGDGAHGGHDGGAAAPMPGMATRAELVALGEASGEDAERQFLALMIPHHEAGVTMAEEAVDRATEDVVRDLAGAIVRSQQAELDLLRGMLAERGGAPDAG